MAEDTKSTPTHASNFALFGAGEASEAQRTKQVMQRKSLHDLSADQFLLVDSIESIMQDVNDGVAGAEDRLKELLDERITLDGSVKDKFEGYVEVMDEIEARSESLRAYAQVMQNRINGMLERARSLASAHKNMKDRLKVFMELHDMKKLETDRFRFTVNNNGGMLPIVYDPMIDMIAATVDPKYKKDEIDGAKVREALNSGEELWWAKYGERGTHLRIK